MPATRKKKKFIDKKNAVTFHLVHRSQRDPLQADEDAGKHVLLPQQAARQTSTVEQRKEEQRKFGVFYDDDYNYMQHLRDVDELNQVEPVEFVPADSVSETKLQLPSTAFASKTETDVGLLNKAVPIRGPQPDWDPDIVAALDDDFDMNDPDNILDDDFIIQANAGVGFEGIAEGEEFVTDEEYGSEEDFASDEAEGEMYDTFDPDNLDSFADEETKSRFTNYSMSSSVIRRNQGLTLLDDRFEKLFREYDEDEIGALDHEEIDGRLGQNSELLNNAMEEFEKKYSTKTTLKEVVKQGEEVEVVSESDSEEDGEMVKLVMEEKPEKAWDCESILSTYSNLYNHPKTIEEPRKLRKPRTASENKAMEFVTIKDVERELNKKNTENKASTSGRPKEETAEEKKLRKQAIKAERRERRVEKKMTKQAFQQEERRQQKELMNLQQNLQGIKMT